MLGGSDLKGRARDQRGQVLGGESTNLDASAFGLCVELCPVSEVSGRRVKEPKQAAWRTKVDHRLILGGHRSALVSPIQVTSISG
jgi:hypothetical protein